MSTPVFFIWESPPPGLHQPLSSVLPTCIYAKFVWCSLLILFLLKVSTKFVRQNWDIIICLTAIFKSGWLSNLFWRRIWHQNPFSLNTLIFEYQLQCIHSSSTVNSPETCKEKYLACQSLSQSLGELFCLSISMYEGFEHQVLLKDSLLYLLNISKSRTKVTQSSLDSYTIANNHHNFHSY